MLCDAYKMHQIWFRSGLSPDPRESSRRFHRHSGWLRRKIPLFHFL